MTIENTEDKKHMNDSAQTAEDRDGPDSVAESDSDEIEAETAEIAEILDQELILPLTEAEVLQFGECERVIARNLIGFQQTGAALLTIHDEKLWRGSHRSWDDYLQRRWGLHRTYAHYLMKTTEVYRDIEAFTVVNAEKAGTEPVLPTSERQLRPIISVPPDQRGEVWEKAVADNNGLQPTAAQMQAAVNEITPEIVPSPNPPPPRGSYASGEPDRPITTDPPPERPANPEVPTPSPQYVVAPGKNEALLWHCSYEAVEDGRTYKITDYPHSMELRVDGAYVGDWPTLTDAMNAAEGIRAV